LLAGANFGAAFGQGAYGRSALEAFEHLFFAINEGIDVVGGEFETVAVSDGVCGAGFDAIAAEDAARIIDVVDLGVTLARRDALFFGVLRSFNVNAIGGAGRGAQKTADAFFQTHFVAMQDVNAAIARLEINGRGGIILGHRFFKHGFERDGEAFDKCDRSCADFGHEQWHKDISLAKGWSSGKRVGRYRIAAVSDQ